MMKLFFAVYPYICLTVFVIGSWIRYDHEQYTWKSDSSQLLDNKHMVLASNLFHVGILAIFLGHFAGLVLPHRLWLALGVSDMQHQWVAIAAGSVFGIMCLPVSYTHLDVYKRQTSISPTCRRKCTSSSKIPSTCICRVSATIA